MLRSSQSKSSSYKRQITTMYNKLMMMYTDFNEKGATPELL